ncbi:MAG: helix-turn-helix domain-containing protein [Nanoarchaeota archaeon]
MNKEELELAIAEGEGPAIEFKERYSSKIDEDIVAFATSRGGTILIGIRDDKTITGEKLTGELKARIHTLARNCRPSIEVSVSQIKNVVAIEVPEGKHKPYSCSSGFFKRLDAVTQKMDNDEIRAMFAENDTVPFEEKRLKQFSVSDISYEKVAAFLKEAEIKAGKIPISELLESLKVADSKGFKNASALFFAKDAYKHILQCRMTLIAFKGLERLHIFDRMDVKDDLLTQFNSAMFFIKKHLKIRTEIKGIDRKDIYEIPLEALREAVTNAIIHRDYSFRGTNISVEFYDDRVEISSPGGLVKGLSMNEFGMKSIRRNELVADLFSRMDKVERAGTGVRRMRDAMKDAGLKEPVFKADSFFTAVFYKPEDTPRKDLEKVGGKLGIKSGIKSGINEEKIISIINDNPSVTGEQLSQQIGISITAIENNIAKLKKKGILKRIGSRKNGYWEVIESS